jgi:formyltetrahydrofolate-dependent phosphoribosylglycinamide formyltransferase
VSAPRIAVLVSGTGRHLRNILVMQRAGDLPGETLLVISSKPGVPALDHAREFGVPWAVLKESEITAALDLVRPDLVVMAGYLRRWPIPPRYEGRTINIHPALLPLFGGKGFYGHRVHEAVLASGMRQSGCTVHFVTGDYDRGPIIAQAAVPVLPDDTPESLADRVFAAERVLLPRAIRDVLSGAVTLDQGQAVFRREP